MKKTTAFVLCFLLALGLFAPASVAKTDLVFTLSQPSGVVGDTVEVEIRVQASFTGKEGLYAYQFELTYDTEALEFVDARKGEAAANFMTNSNEGFFVGVCANGSRATGVLHYVTFKLLREGGGFLLLKDIEISCLDETGKSESSVNYEPVPGAVVANSKPAPTVNASAYASSAPRATANPDATPEPQSTENDTFPIEPTDAAQPNDIAQQTTAQPTEFVTPTSIADEPDAVSLLDNEGVKSSAWIWGLIIGIVVLAAAVVAAVLIVRKRKAKQAKA